MRVSQFRQRRRSDILHGLLLGRGVHHLRQRGGPVHPHGAGRARGSHV